MGHYLKGEATPAQHEDRDTTLFQDVDLISPSSSTQHQAMSGALRVRLKIRYLWMYALYFIQHDKVNQQAQRRRCIALRLSH